MKNSGIENCNLNKGVINLSSLLCMNALVLNIFAFNLGFTVNYLFMEVKACIRQIIFIL